MKALKDILGFVSTVIGIVVAVATIAVSIPGPVNHWRLDLGTFLMLAAGYLIAVGVGLLN